MSEESDDKLHEVLDKVHDEATFLDFILALSQDWEDEERKEKINPSPPYGPGANGWENGTIGSYLERANAWGMALLDRDDGPGDRGNAWRRAAAIMYAGKYYE